MSSKKSALAWSESTPEVPARTTTIVATIRILVDVEDHAGEEPTDAEARATTVSFVDVVSVVPEQVTWRLATPDECAARHECGRKV